MAREKQCRSTIKIWLAIAYDPIGILLRSWRLIATLAGLWSICLKVLSFTDVQKKPFWTPTQWIPSPSAKGPPDPWQCLRRVKGGGTVKSRKFPGIVYVKRNSLGHWGLPLWWDESQAQNLRRHGISKPVKIWGWDLGEAYINPHLLCYIRL